MLYIQNKTLCTVAILAGTLPGLFTVAVPAEAGGISWTAKRAAGTFSAATRTRAAGTPGGGTYTGPGDTTGGTAGSAPSGMSNHRSVCSPLDSNLCVTNVWMWDYVANGLQDGFTYLSACHAFSEETLLMQNFAYDSGWTGYPRVTCDVPTYDIYSAAQYSHYYVPCANTNPRDLTNALVLDLGADVISTTSVMDLCELEVDAGLH